MEIHRIAVAEVSVINHLRFLADVHGIKQPTSETASMNGIARRFILTCTCTQGTCNFLSADRLRNPLGLRRIVNDSWCCNLKSCHLVKNGSDARSFSGDFKSQTEGHGFSGSQ